MIKRKIFIATHANLSEGFKNAAKLIAGDKAEAIETFTLFEGKSADYFREEIKKYIDKNRSVEKVILTDLFGASLFNAMSLLANEENTYVFSGVNLAMLLDLILDPSPLDKDSINDRLKTYKDGVVYLDKIEKGIEEDF